MPAVTNNKKITTRNRDELLYREISDQVGDDKTREEILHLLKELRNDKRVVMLSEEEVVELREWLSDKKAIGRALSIFKTIVIGVAATIVAWNTVFDSGIKVLLNWIGLGGASN